MVRVVATLSVTFALFGGALAQTPQTPPTPPVQAPAYSFPVGEAMKAMAFWSQPGRYSVSPPDDFRDKGLWQVRLTVAGSTWIWNYNRARHASAPPTQDAQSANAQQQAWAQWIQSKVDRDRWEANQVAQQANLQVAGTAPLKPDPSISVTEPPRPTPIPPDLLALAGTPPRFAEAVVPMKHQVVFDDATIAYLDNVKLGNPKYPYYRFRAGVMDEGVAVKTLPDDRLKSLMALAGLDDATAHAMVAVSKLEGGFDSVNTYDTGYVSVGFIQFACLKEGGGSLGTLLLQYKQDKPDKFEADFQQFGIDVGPDGKFDILDPDTNGEIRGSDAALKMIEDKRLVAVFERAGQKSDDFIAAQIKSAKVQFYPADDVVNVTINAMPVTIKVSDVIKSEAGLATLMDRKVNTGSLGQFAAIVNSAADQIHAMSVDDVAKFEASLVAAMKYRTNFLLDSTLTQPAPSPYELHLPSPGGK